ncbi:MAG: hypothetical protein Q7S56_01530, partial [Nanoarchaeota archaeon]|nr:hypothetical protein [Nanoarchaeota archaeon]
MVLSSNNLKFEAIKKIAEVSFKVRDLGNVSKIDSNSPPSIFVGSGLKYPLVNVGILSPLARDENAWLYDDAKYWAENNFGIGDVVKLRDSLLNSRFTSKVSDARLNSKFVEIAKEIALSSRPVDVEIELKSRLRFEKEKDRILMPQGLKAPLKSARITENVKIDQKVDKVVNDEIKASEGIEFLYKNNFNEYTLSKILSVGVLGLKKDKKLVPTRWSITATDDMISKALLEKVREYKWIEDYQLFFGEFLGNQYAIMMFPDVWSFELFELYFPGSSWNPTAEVKASTDMETYDGRKEYAFNTAGGYYATRLPILEYLNSINRQANVIAIRLETPSYWAALGVWVVRESVRKALNNKIMKF